jgi:hypothetical protein
VLRIAITLSRIWTRETWGPVASTLTTTPPRKTDSSSHCRQLTTSIATVRS